MKQSMKKPLSLFVAVLMIVTTCISVFPLTAFATSAYADDDTAIAAGMYFRIGELNSAGSTYAATISDAISAAVTNTTIYMLRDYSVAGGFTVTGKNLTIDGGLGTDSTADKRGFTYKETTSYMYVKGDGSLTIKNANFDFVSGVILEGGTLVCDNVYGSVTSRPFAKGTGTTYNANLTITDGTYKTNSITIKNSFIENKTAGEVIIQLEQLSHGTVDIINSTLKSIGTLGSTQNNNNLVRLVARGNQTLNIDAASTIEMAQTTNNSTYAGKEQYVVDINNSVLLKSDSGVSHKILVNMNGTLKCNSAGLTTKQGFLKKSNDSNLTINYGSTAKFAIGENVKANTNVVFPTIGENTFVSGSKSVTSGGTYKKTSSDTTELIFDIYDPTASTVTDDESAIENGMFIRVGVESEKNYFTTLADAINEAKTVTKTIYLIHDYSFASGITVNGDFDITIDGQNHTLTNANSGNYMMYARGGASVTIQNITMNLRGGFVTEHDSGAFALKNATVTTTTRPLWYNGGGSAESPATGHFMTMENVTALHNPTHVSAGNNDGQAMIQSAGYAQGATLKIKGNTTLTQACTAGDQVGNGSVINIIQNSTLNVTIGEGCELINAAVASNDGNTGYVLNLASNKSGSKVTLENGSKLTVSGETLKTVKFINEKDTVTVNDMGCTYAVKKGVRSNADVTLPGAVKVNGNKLLAYSTSAGLMLGTVAKDENATADLTLTAVGCNFDMVDGASIRTEAPYGIRFTATVDKSFYELLTSLDANTEFGIVLGPQKYIGSMNFFEKLELQNASQYAKIVCTDSSMTESGDQLLFRAAVYINGDGDLNSAGKTQFEAKMTANAYVTYHLADGSEITVWADWDADDNSRSIYDVAKAHYKTTQTDNATIRNILTACGYFDAQ